MAFPDNVDVFLQSQDPSTAQDIQNIKTYQSLLGENKFSEAYNLLFNQMTNGIQMSLNAGRYNQVIDAIVAIENFYLGLNGVKEYIQNNASAFTNYKQWENSITYSVGNFVGHNSSWYSCIQQNTNIKPGVTSNWQNYWALILKPQYAKKYYVTTDPPPSSEIESGGLWFQKVSQ